MNRRIAACTECIERIPGQVQRGTDPGFQSVLPWVQRGTDQGFQSVLPGVQRGTDPGFHPDPDAPFTRLHQNVAWIIISENELNDKKEASPAEDAD